MFARGAPPAILFALLCATTAAAVTFPPPPYILRSSRVLLPHGSVAPADIFIGASGQIDLVLERDDESPVVEIDATGRIPSGMRLVDVSPLLVMPGLIDPHVHINSPGRTAWEGFASGTRAAAAGGTTTILDMPLNNVPSTVSVKNMAAKAVAMAAEKLAIDVGLIGGIVPGNLDEIPEMHIAGVHSSLSWSTASPKTSRTCPSTNLGRQ
jgi:allantoinase